MLVGVINAHLFKRVIFEILESENIQKANTNKIDSLIFWQNSLIKLLY